MLDKIIPLYSLDMDQDDLNELQEELRCSRKYLVRKGINPDDKEILLKIAQDDKHINTVCAALFVLMHHKDLNKNFLLRIKDIAENARGDRARAAFDVFAQHVREKGVNYYVELVERGGRNLNGGIAALYEFGGGAGVESMICMAKRLIQSYESYERKLSVGTVERVLDYIERFGGDKHKQIAEELRDVIIWNRSIFEDKIKIVIKKKMKLVTDKIGKIW